MKPITEKLDELRLNWGMSPSWTLMEIFGYDKLLIAVDRRNCYQITDEEKAKIEIFPLAKVKNRLILSSEVCTEIDGNIRDYQFTEYHLKNYLQSIVDDMYNITDTIRVLNYIDELEKIGGFIIHDPFGQNETEQENSRLLVDFLQAHLTNYQNYQMVLNHAISWQRKQAFFNGGIIEVHLEQKTNEPSKYPLLELDSSIINQKNIISETPLIGLFKDKPTYDKVIQLMITKGVIIKNPTGLKWCGLRKGCAYQVAAFCDALFSKDLLNHKVDDYRFMKPILQNTFTGFSISDRTFRNKSIAVSRVKFDAILSEI
jgi:hypothetical protein